MSYAELVAARSSRRRLSGHEREARARAADAAARKPPGAAAASASARKRTDRRVTRPGVRRAAGQRRRRCSGRELDARAAAGRGHRRRRVTAMGVPADDRATRSAQASARRASRSSKIEVDRARPDGPDDGLSHRARPASRAAMPLVDLDGDPRAICCSYGWVADARVSRRLPDTLVVDIVERKPAAIWQHQQRLHADRRRRACCSSRSIRATMPDLPLVIGPDANRAGGDLADAARTRRRAEAAGRGRDLGRQPPLGPAFHSGETLALPEGEARRATRWPTSRNAMARRRAARARDRALRHARSDAVRASAALPHEPGRARRPRSGDRRRAHAVACGRDAAAIGTMEQWNMVAAAHRKDLITALDIGSSKVVGADRAADRGRRAARARHRAAREPGRPARLYRRHGRAPRARCARRSSRPSGSRAPISRTSGSAFRRAGCSAMSRRSRSSSAGTGSSSTISTHLLAAGRNSIDPEGRMVLHAQPALYTLDGLKGVKNPLGLHADRLGRRYPCRRRRPRAGAQPRSVRAVGASRGEADRRLAGRDRAGVPEPRRSANSASRWSSSARG